MSVDFLVKLRDAATMIADACQEQLEKQAPPGAVAVKEETFLTLKFDAIKSDRLVGLEAASKSNNLADKWNSAFNILRQSNSTIKSRYRGDNYEFSYWIYGDDRIFRQPLKQK